MIINGNSHEVLSRMEENSIDMGATSPPYYSPVEGIRDYEIEPVTWPDGWTGILGSEPTPQEYVDHLSLICMDFYRVLRPWGRLWLNIGDSRAGSGRGPSGHNAAVKNQEERQGFVGKHQKIPPGFKRKDMFGIPFRVGMDLQSKGWYWRDCIPWIKRNGMVGSYKDRPVSNIEWILILDKTDNPFFDHVAIMEKASESYLKDKRPRGVLRQRVNDHTKFEGAQYQPKKQDMTGNVTTAGFNARYKETGHSDMRFFRSSDFFFKTFQGLWLDEKGEPLAMIVNPGSYNKGKHTASFPVLLPQTCILGSTSEKGHCPECGSPWRRLSEKQYIEEKVYDIVTTGWEPTCKCGQDTTVPGVVCDFFAGSSATGVACKNTKRHYLGIDISSDYCNESKERINDGK
jgi:DNA modification methylase